MKKSIALSMVFLLMLNIFSINVFAGNSSDFTIGVASNSVKITRDQILPDGLGSVLKFEAARNEFESGQVIIKAGSSALSLTEPVITDLVCTDQAGEVNGSIAASNIKVYVEHYINVSTTETVNPTGWYPDALIPVDRYLAKNGSINVDTGKNQGLWFTVKIAKDKPAGNYTGTFSIKINGTVTSIPVELTVWDFTLTDESHSKTAFEVRPNMFKFAYPGTDFENTNLTEAERNNAKAKAYSLTDAYYKFLLDYRITPTDLPVQINDPASFAENAKACLTADPRITAYRIPFFPDDLDKSKEFINSLNNAGILDKGFIYFIDEPKKADYVNVASWSDKIIQIGDELGISKIRHLVTVGFDPGLYGKVNLWCPILAPFGSETFINQAKERMQLGDEVWWYTCTNPSYPYVSYHTNDYLIGSRLLSWMQKSYGIQGNLYYGVNIFGKFHDGIGPDPRDVWNDPYAWESTPGDGYLLYPGVDYGTDDPFPTVRLEAIREGNEDYEYMHMLEEKVNAAAAKLGVDVKADDILKPIYERLFTSVKNYTKDTTLLDDARKEIAGMIMALDKNPSSLVVVGNLAQDYSSRTVTVYAESASTVKINGVAAGKTSSENNADKFVASVPCNAGINELKVQVSKDADSVEVDRKFLVSGREPATYDVMLYNAEDDNELPRWTSTVSYPDDRIPVVHTTEFYTERTQGLKVTYPGNLGAGINPDVELDLLKGGFYDKDFSKYSTFEFDVCNKGELPAALYLTVTDGHNSSVCYPISLNSGAKSHFAVPIDELAQKGLDTKDIVNLKFWMKETEMGGKDSPICFDYLHFTAEQKFSILPSIVTKKADSSDVKIDGVFDEAVWSNNVNNEIKQNLDTTPDNKAKFGTAWNEQYLYVAVDVEDANVVDPASEAPFLDDNVEVYIDGNMNKDAYDEHTVQYHFRFGDDVVHKGPYNDMATTNGIVFKMIKTEKGYTLEAAIPWTAINTTAQDGKYAGFNVMIDDRDGSGDSANYSNLGYVREVVPSWVNSANYADLLLAPDQNGDSGQHSNYPGTVPETAIVIEGGAAKSLIGAELDLNNGTAAATVTSAFLSKMFEKAIDAADGSKKAIIEIPEIAGATAYKVEFDAADLSNLNSADKKIEIRTSFGNIMVTGSMFAADQLTDVKKIAISIGTADKSVIDQSLREQIGDRPVIDLKVMLDGKAAEWENPDAPVDVSFNYEPSQKELSDPEHIVVWYIDGAGKAIPVTSGRYDEKTGMIKFITTHFSKYAVACVHKTFNDIDSWGWAKKPIEVMASKGIINGTASTTYTPQANITRADFVMLLVKVLNLEARFDTNFTDVKAADYYYNAVGTAKKLGILNGVGDNRFNPCSYIARQDMMTMTAKALLIAKNEAAKGTAADIAGYKDISKISSYAVDSVALLVKKGIVEGNNNLINPSADTSRAEAAVIIYRLYNMYEF